jgi:CRISPR/Cas system-associated exonuclease Cas4 (RecB family)
MGDLIKNNNFGGLSKAFETAKLEEVLEEASTKGGRQGKWTKKKSFAPSSFYGLGNGVCPRYWYYAFNGAEFEFENTARQRANMDSGTAAGERIAGLFENAGILKGAELEVINQDPPIFGYMDLMVEWQGEDMPGEVKTTRTESFAQRAATMSAPGYQLIQLLIYMRVYKKDKGFFVIEDKNTHELLIIPVKMTDKNNQLVDRVFEWMRTVKENADEGELPKRPFTKSSFNCKSCPVKSTCWEGYKRGSVNGTDPNPGTIDLPPLAVPK